MHISPVSSFARPSNTTQYAQNELVANSATASLVVPLKWNVERIMGKGKIVRVLMYTSAAGVTTATFNLHLFTADPGTPGAGDNGAYSVTSVADWLATVACDMATGSEVTSADKAKGFVITGGYVFDVGIGSTNAIYGLVETATAATYTPASAEVFKFRLEIEGMAA